MAALRVFWNLRMEWQRVDKSRRLPPPAGGEISQGKNQHLWTQGQGVPSIHTQGVPSVSLNANLRLTPADVQGKNSQPFVGIFPQLFWSVLLLCTALIACSPSPEQHPQRVTREEHNTARLVLALDTFHLSPAAAALVSTPAIVHLVRVIDSVAPDLRFVLRPDSPADGTLQLHFGRIHRVVRCRAIVQWRNHRRDTGTGYGIIRYQTAAGQWIPLPAYYDALFRAMAAALPQPMAHVSPADAYRLPADPVVVLGIAFLPSPYAARWKIYAEKILLSYRVSAAIVQELAHSNHWVVFDLDSRDSLYRQGGLLGVENYNPPTPEEWKLLADAGIPLAVVGAIRLLTPWEAEATLQLIRLNGTERKLIAEHRRRFTADNADTVQAVFRALAAQLRQHSAQSPP